MRESTNHTNPTPTEDEMEGPTPMTNDRVRMEPVRLAWIEALVEGDQVFAERFSIPVVPGWAGFPEALPPTLEAARRRGADPWGSHLIFDAADGALAGFGGFKGAPAGGRVEIGYAVAPGRQGRGLATAAARLMVARARAAGVRTVVAHTLAEPNPSTSVLARCGFTKVATVPDPDLGADVWRWELPLSSAADPRKQRWRGPMPLMPLTTLTLVAAGALIGALTPATPPAETSPGRWPLGRGWRRGRRRRDRVRTGLRRPPR